MLGFLQSLLSPVKVGEVLVEGAVEAREGVRRGDRAVVEGLLGKQVPTDLRLTRIDDATRDVSIRGAVAKWRAASPNDPLAASVSASVGLHWAWAARGVDWVPRNYAEFQRRLAESEQAALAAVSLDPKDPAPWHLLVTYARGRQLGVEETMRRFKEALARSGPSYAVGLAGVQSFAEKWGAPAGTDEQAVSLACSKAPAGHLAHALPVHVALERFGARCMTQNRFTPDLMNMLDLVQMVRHAETMWHGARKGVTPLDKTAHSALGFAHWCMGNTSLAAPHLRVVKPVFPDTPWGIEDGRAGLARRACRECGV